MPIIVNCPSCERKLRVPEELLGQQVKCPTCATVFDAAAAPPPAPEPPPAPGPAAAPDLSRPRAESDRPSPAPAADPPSGPAPDAEDSPPTPRRRRRFEDDDEDRREEGEDDDRPWEGRHPAFVRRDCEPHRGNLVLTLGIVSLVLEFCPVVGLSLGIAAWIMGGRDLRKMRAKEMDPLGVGTTQAGWICGIVGTVLGALWTLGCSAYIGFIFWVTTNTMNQMKRMTFPAQPVGTQRAVPPRGVQPPPPPVKQPAEKELP